MCKHYAVIVLAQFPGQHRIRLKPLRLHEPVQTSTISTYVLTKSLDRSKSLFVVSAALRSHVQFSSENSIWRKFSCSAAAPLTATCPSYYLNILPQIGKKPKGNKLRERALILYNLIVVQAVVILDSDTLIYM